MVTAAFDPDALQRVPRFAFADMSRVAPRLGAIPPVAPTAPAAVAPLTATGRMAAQIPTLARGASAMTAGARGALGFGARALPVAGAVLAAGGEAAGVADVAADPTKTGADVATRAAEGVGRLATAGAGAGLGLAAAGPIGAAVGGTLGYFAPNAVYGLRDWWMNRGATPPPAAPVAAPAAAGPGAVPVSAGATGRRPDVLPGEDVTPANAPVTAMTAADIRGTAIPASGTGGIVNNATGAVTMLDSRDGGAVGGTGYGANPAAYAPTQYRTEPVASAPAGAPPGYTPTPARGAVALNEPAAGAAGSVGSYVGAVLNQNRAAQTEARKLAAEKLRVEGLGKGATAARDVAIANREALQTAAARAHLAANPGDYAGAAAAAAGRALPRNEYSVPFPPMSDKDPVTVLNKGTGALERRQPTQAATEANITATMAARKMTRAQVIEAYKKQGFDVSRIKP